VGYAFYYVRRRDRNAREKVQATPVFTDLALRLGGTYEHMEQSGYSLIGYADLGRITGQTPTLSYELGCYPRGSEDVGGQLHCTVRPPGKAYVFDLPSRSGTWSRASSSRRDSVRAAFGRRYAEATRADVHRTLVTLAGTSFDVQLRPEDVTACAPAEVFEWRERADNHAAATWVNALLAVVNTLPQRPT
jgi:hypothetical protein